MGIKIKSFDIIKFYELCLKYGCYKYFFLKFFEIVFKIEIKFV